MTDAPWDRPSPPMTQVERLGFTLIEDLGQQAASKVWARAGRRLSGLCARRLLQPEGFPKLLFLLLLKPLFGYHVPRTLHDTYSLYAQAGVVFPPGVNILVEVTFFFNCTHISGDKLYWNLCGVILAVVTGVTLGGCCETVHCFGAYPCLYIFFAAFLTTALLAYWVVMRSAGHGAGGGGKRGYCEGRAWCRRVSSWIASRTLTPICTCSHDSTRGQLDAYVRGFELSQVPGRSVYRLAPTVRSRRAGQYASSQHDVHGGRAFLQPPPSPVGCSTRGWLQACSVCTPRRCVSRRYCVSPRSCATYFFLRCMFSFFAVISYNMYVLLPCPLPFNACCAFLSLKESGIKDRHTSLALHSIQLKNFGPFREEVRPIE